MGDAGDSDATDSVGNVGIAHHGKGIQRSLGNTRGTVDRNG